MRLRVVSTTMSCTLAFVIGVARGADTLPATKHWPRLVVGGARYSFGLDAFERGRHESDPRRTPMQADRIPAVPAPVDGTKQKGLPVLPPGWRFVGRPSVPGFDQPLPQSAASLPTPRSSTPNASSNQATLGAPAPAAATVSSASLWIPLASNVSIAAFRTGMQTTVVIDGQHAFGLAALRGLPSFADLTVTMTDDTTVLKFTVKPSLPVALLPRPGGWILKLGLPDTHAPAETVSDTNEIDDIDPVPRDASILLPTPHAARVIAMADPQSGRRLLIGLVSGSDHLSIERRAIGFALRPSLVGVVLAADADQVTMRRGRDGFVIAAPSDPDFPLRIAGRAVSVADDGLFAGDTASLDDIPNLRESARRAVMQAALSPPGQRFDARIKAARAALALDDASTARGIMHVALRDNPEGANRAGVAMIRLALQGIDPHRDDDAIADDEETAPATGPEAQFWRGIIASRARQASGGQTPDTAASVIRAGLGRALHYPAPLRRRAVGLAAEILARANRPVSPTVTNPILPERDGAFLHALVSLHSLHPDDGALMRLSHDVDPVIAAKAQELVIDRSRAQGAITPGDAADRYDLLRPGARLAGREGAVMGKELEALQAARRWPEAMSLLDTIVNAKSVSQDTSQALRRAAVRGMLADPALVSANARTSLSLVALLLPHLTLLDDPAAKGEALSLVTRRLVALGLSNKALSVLDSYAPVGSTIAAQPELALLRAQIDFESGRKDDARHALEGVSNASLLPPLGQDRAVLSARFAMIDGDPRKAIALLTGIDRPDAWTMMADACEQVQDWGGASQALNRALAPALAGSATLTAAQQADIVRLGADALRGRDQSTLDHLRTRAQPRMTDPTLQPAFALLMRPDQHLENHAATQQ